VTDDLQTDRLLLRRLTRIDVLAICGTERRADWADGYPTEGDREVASLLLASAYDGTEHLGHRQVVDRASGLVIGGIGFFGGPGPDREVSVGYGVAPEWRGRGLATEALTAMLGYACASGLVRRVVADTEADHTASRRVMEKAGMALERVDGGHVRYAYDCVAAVRSAP
jgi:RimJ/RimL family protein N-acetyltransferase